MAGLKRRHEESTYSAPQSQLRQEGHRNVGNLSINNNYNTEEDRVHSPNSIMETHSVFMPPTRESKRALSFASKTRHDAENDPDAEKRVTIWNWREQRKLSGNSAPFKKNLKDYIRKHPDWEEYVGQDKDAITGKKLSPKKMKPPAPQDPDHPWYTMQRTGVVTPTSPAAQPASSQPAHTSSYGTRSTQPRLHESESMHQRTSPKAHQAPQVAETNLVNPELSQPMQINLESPAVVAQRRSIEMAARLQALASEVSEVPSNDESQNKHAEVEAEKAAAALAWKAASDEVARLKVEKEAAQRKLAEEAQSQRQSAHAEIQCQVVSSAMARIEAFRNKRRMIAA
jgi:hypothetical protein